MSSPPRTNERVALVVVTLASFLTPFMGSATNVALPAIGREMGLDAVDPSWVATSYMRLVGQMLSMGVASLVLAVFVGREAVGPGRVTGFVTGMRVAFVLYALLCVAGVFASLARGRAGYPPVP